MPDLGPEPALDDTDLCLIAELSRDGRLATTELAARLGLTKRTALARLRRLEAERLVKVQAVTDMAACGYPVLVVVAVRVIGRPARAVAAEIADRPEAILVDLALGDYDVNIWLLATNAQHAEELAAVVAGVPGVGETETVVCLRVHQWTRLHAILT